MCFVHDCSKMSDEKKNFLKIFKKKIFFFLNSENFGQTCLYKFSVFKYFLKVFKYFKGSWAEIEFLKNEKKISL